MSKKTKHHKDGSLTLSEEDASTLFDALWVIRLAMWDLETIFDFSGKEQGEEKDE